MAATIKHLLILVKELPAELKTRGWERSARNGRIVLGRQSLFL